MSRPLVCVCALPSRPLAGARGRVSSLFAAVLIVSDLSVPLDAMCPPCEAPVLEPAFPRGFAPALLSFGRDIRSQKRPAEAFARRLHQFRETADKIARSPRSA